LGSCWSYEIIIKRLINKEISLIIPRRTSQKYSCT
jgi:hypothetical protein